MRSARSYFNTGLYLKNLKRYWPLWTAYLVIWALMVPVNLLTTPENVVLNVDSVGYDLLGAAATAGPEMAFVFAILSAMALFGYLYTSSSANMIASLPTRREGTFLSCFAAGLTWLIGANLLVTLLTLAVELGSGLFGLRYLIEFFAMLSLQCLFFFGLASFCAMLTGRLPVLPCLYLLLNFVALLEHLVRGVMEGFVYGFHAGSDMLLLPLCPIVQISAKVRVAWEAGGTAGVTNLWMLAVYAAVGLVLAAAALLLYRRRQMESAGDVIAIRVLRPVVRYAAYFGCALVLGMLLYVLLFPVSGNIWKFLICAAVGGLIGYFGVEMLMRMSFRVFRRSYRGALVCTALLCGLLAAVHFDLFGVERYTPALTDVEQVELEYNGSSVELEDADSIAEVITLHKCLIDSKAELQNQNGYYVSVLIRYDLGGRSVTRQYAIAVSAASDELARKLDNAVNCPEALVARVSFPYSIDTHSSAYIYDMRDDHDLQLSSEQLQTLYETCILPDAQDGTLGYEDTVIGAPARSPLSIELNFVHGSGGQEEGYRYKYMTIYPTQEALRTTAYLESLGFPAAVPAGQE